MISFKQRGNFSNAEKFLNQAAKLNCVHVLEKYGREGVAALASATPIDSGLTANSWSYEINISGGVCKLTWLNSNFANGVPVAIVLQYGHATRNGGFVQGRDYINPAIKPIFDKIAADVWKEVTRR